MKKVIFTLLVHALVTQAHASTTPAFSLKRTSSLLNLRELSHVEAQRHPKSFQDEFRYINQKAPSRFAEFPVEMAYDMCDLITKKGLLLQKISEDVYTIDISWGSIKQALEEKVHLKMK